MSLSQFCSLVDTVYMLVAGNELFVSTLWFLIPIMSFLVTGSSLIIDPPDVVHSPHVTQVPVFIVLIVNSVNLKLKTEWVIFHSNKKYSPFLILIYDWIMTCHCCYLSYSYYYFSSLFFPRCSKRIRSGHYGSAAFERFRVTL